MPSVINVQGTRQTLCDAKTIVKGTQYKIIEGTSVIGGTVHTIPFQKRVTLSIYKGEVEKPFDGNASVTVDGKSYSASNTLTVYTGSIVTCTVTSTTNSTSKVRHNGLEVKSTSSKGTVTYEHEITGDTVISCVSRSGSGDVNIYDSGYIRFTMDYVEYPAIEGQTWTKWIGSEPYVLSGASAFIDKSGYVHSTSASTYFPIYSTKDHTESSPVRTTELIIANQSYYTPDEEFDEEKT